jgi:hypothetical protein
MPHSPFFALNLSFRHLLPVQHILPQSWKFHNPVSFVLIYIKFDIDQPAEYTWLTLIYQNEQQANTAQQTELLLNYWQLTIIAQENERCRNNLIFL